MANKPDYEPLLEELFDAGIRVALKAAKRGAAAVVGSALEDVNKAGSEIGKRIDHAKSRLRKILEESDDHSDN